MIAKRISDKKRDKRGELGSKNLKKHQNKIVNDNMKKLKATLKYYIENQIPLIQKQLVQDCGISVSTLNRSPYKEEIKKYKEKEKSLLSPKGRQEVSALIEENKRLRNELENMKEKYSRLKKEINYSKELFE